MSTENSSIHRWRKSGGGYGVQLRRPPAAGSEHRQGQGDPRFKAVQRDTETGRSSGEGMSARITATAVSLEDGRRRHQFERTASVQRAAAQTSGLPTPLRQPPHSGPEPPQGWRTQMLLRAKQCIGHGGAAETPNTDRITMQ
ncbi:unnamed protein product [Arctogadus glacialis]